jgi:hypothetical protein
MGPFFMVEIQDAQALVLNVNRDSRGILFLVHLFTMLGEGYLSMTIMPTSFHFQQ